MEKYRASSKDAQVSGLLIYPLFLGLLKEQYSSILDQEQLSTETLEEWYPQQFILDLLKTIRTRVTNELVLVSVGLSWAGEGPPEFDSFREFILLLEEIYAASSDGLGEGDMLLVNVIDEAYVEVVNATPYPDDLMYGYLYGIARRYGVDVSLNYKDGLPVNSNDNMIYEIRWQSKEVGDEA